MVAKKITGLFALLVSVSIMGGCSTLKGSTSSDTLSHKKEIKIGITQIVEHSALDSARKGFIDGLKSKGFEDGKNLKVEFQNAQGDMQTAQSIAKKFVAQKQDLILAIATPTAQAAYNATKDIPIVITAVTDPVEIGLVKSLDKPETNVTGTSDTVPIEKHFEFLKRILPTKKKVGILYNTSEKNSEIQLENAKKAAPKFGLELVIAGVTNVNEVPQVLSSLLEKVDVLFAPSDNMVTSSMPLIADQCFKKNVPIIASDKAQVASGALASNGVDYYDLGVQTAVIAVEILNGKSPKEIPVQTVKEMKLTINTDAAKKLNIVLPKDIEEKAEKVTGGVNR